MAVTQLGAKAVGSIVKLKVNNTAREFIVVHQGKPSSIYDASCDGTWLLLKDVYEKRQWHSSNVNDYAGSTIHSYLNSTFYNLFDANIRNAIKQVKIPYVKGSGVSTGANGLSCKIFLLAARELGRSDLNPQNYPNDGAKLAYFDDGHTSSKRIGCLDGVATSWHLRTPFTNSWTFLHLISIAGSFNGYNCIDIRGFAPPLCSHPPFGFPMMARSQPTPLRQCPRPSPFPPAFPAGQPSRSLGGHLPMPMETWRVTSPSALSMVALRGVKSIRAVRGAPPTRLRLAQPR